MKHYQKLSKKAPYKIIKEFERLGNKVSGWTQKALVGKFMGELEPEVAEGIQMFKPKTLKEAISLIRMKDDHLIRQKKTLPMSSTTSRIIKSSPTMKWLSWEEMQKRRTQGLCINCDDKFTSGHKCKGPQRLVLDGGQQWRIQKLREGGGGGGGGRIR